MKRKFRFLHKWIGIASCFFVIIVSLTAIALNHKDLYQIYTLKGNNKKTFSLNDIRTMATDPFNPTHIIASNQKDLLFQSFDNGNNWFQIKLFVPTEKVNNISFSPSEPDMFAISLKEVGIFLTDDGGEVWEQIETPFYAPEGEYIEFLNLSKENIINIKTQYGYYTFDYDNEKWDEKIIKGLNKEKEIKFSELIYNLHTGKTFGSFGKYLYDIISLGLIFLSISGLIISFRKKKKRRVKKIEQKNLIKQEIKTN